MELAYCGLNCGGCPVYLASVTENTSEQIRLAKEYSTDTCKFSKEDLFCLGCHSDTRSEKMCGDCGIRICGAKKHLTICAQCDEFPCPLLEKYIGDDPDRLNTLKRLAAEYRKAEG